MPIANCILYGDYSDSQDDPTGLWSQATGVSEKHMTINFIMAKAQFGQHYKAMATLYLPSLWSVSDIKTLQLGLAEALAQYLSVSNQEVHVVTQLVESGYVVENGAQVTW